MVLMYGIKIILDFHFIINIIMLTYTNLQASHPHNSCNAYPY